MGHGAGWLVMLFACREKAHVHAMPDPINLKRGGGGVTRPTVKMDSWPPRDGWGPGTGSGTRLTWQPWAKYNYSVTV